MGDEVFGQFSRRMDIALATIKALLGRGKTDPYNQKELTCIHCLDRCKRQQAHRDLQLAPTNRCLRLQCTEIMPYVGLLSLEEDTRLWVKPGSDFLRLREREARVCSESSDDPHWPYTVV